MSSFGADSDTEELALVDSNSSIDDLGDENLTPIGPRSRSPSPDRECKIEQDMANLLISGIGDGDYIEMANEIETIDRKLTDLERTEHEKRLKDLVDLESYIDDTEWMYPPIDQFIPFISEKKLKKRQPYKDPFFPTAGSITTGIVDQATGVATSNPNLKMRVSQTVEDVLAKNINSLPI